MAKKAAPRKKAKAVAPAKPKPKKAAGGKAVLPENQRLRLLYKNQVLVLYNREITGDIRVNHVVLIDENSNILFAKIYCTIGADGNKILKLEQTAKAPPSGLIPIDIDFDDDKCSLWNDITGGNPQIVIGTGDIRNYTGSDMNQFLFTWNVPNDSNDPIWISWEGVNLLRIHASKKPS